MQTIQPTQSLKRLVLIALTSLFLLISCTGMEQRSGTLSLVPDQAGAKSILPDSANISISVIQVSGTGPLGAVLEAQNFLLGGRIAIDGLTPGTWTIQITGYNGTTEHLGTQLTTPASQTVVIASGRTTTASFSLQFLTEGNGSASVQVNWPSTNSSIASVTGVLGDATSPVATAHADAVSGSATLLFPSPVPVGSYPLDVAFVNASGTTISLPMIETVNIYSNLVSTGSISLVQMDVPLAAKPVIRAERATEADPLTITLTSTTTGASIRYLLLSAEPTGSFDWTASTAYTEPFTVASSETRRYLIAAACKGGYQDSLAETFVVDAEDEGSGTIEIIQPPLISHVIVSRTNSSALSPSFAATYSIQGNLTVDAFTWYIDGIAQTDGDGDGDGNTFTYDGTLSLGQHQVMVVFSYHDAPDTVRTASGTLRFAVDGVVATPTLSTQDVIGGKLISLACATPDATIHYTLDGTTPSSASPLYSLPFTISSTNQVKAIALREGVVDSPIFISDSLLVERAATPTFTEDAEAHTVQIICSDATSVYYTLDGTIPDLTGTLYETPLSFEQTATIKAIGVASGKAVSLVGTTTHTVSYALGDTGPGGGLIFLVNADAAHDGWTYLEAAPEETGSYAWTPSSVIIGDTHTEVGTGASNTLSITSKSAEGAAKMCQDKVFGGYEDWFLPSRDELLAMTDLTEGVYWSSSEASTTAAYVVEYADVPESNSVAKTQEHKVRAVRAFL